MIGAVIQLFMMILALLFTLIVWMVRLTVMLVMALVGAISSNSRRR
jgi:hypothetical protein